MKYAFIERHQKQFRIETMCCLFQVSRSGHYDWCRRGVSPREQKQKQLAEDIRNIHKESRATYGSPRILKELLANGKTVNQKTVERIMKVNDIRAKTRKKFKQTTDSRHNLPLAPNLLDRAFDVRKPNLVWISDITYIATDEGWMYLATFIDLFSRKVVGWSMSSRMNAGLVVDAFRMGLGHQQRAPLMVHSDRGSQYASAIFRQALKENRCMRSMSRKGDCWDNAVAESFFATLKKELVHHEKYKTREQARLSVFDYIETFYNRKRIHSHLNFLSPETFEKGAA